MLLGRGVSKLYFSCMRKLSELLIVKRDGLLSISKTREVLKVFIPLELMIAFTELMTYGSRTDVKKRVKGIT